MERQCAVKLCILKGNKVINHLSLLSNFPNTHSNASKQTLSLGSRRSWYSTEVNCDVISGLSVNKTLHLYLVAQLPKNKKTERKDICRRNTI